MSDSNTATGGANTQDKHLEDLIEKATAKDAIKDFNGAAELYSEATQLQAELNGEMSLKNTDLLYAYGKALYNVAVSKSDVLGSRVAGETQAQSSNSPAGNAPRLGPKPQDEKPVTAEVACGESKKEMPRHEKLENKPFFQFTGDENYDDSDSEGEQEGEDADGAEDEDDDFANAFEVLDLARILYHKKLDALEEQPGKGKSSDVPSDVKHIKERLADTYDLQAEISLEAERFADAVADLRTTLHLRQSLFPKEDPSVAECHYKLSLALEFASVSNEDNTEDRHDKVDEDMRKEAATQMEQAIESCQVRMAQEQKHLECHDLDEDKVAALKRTLSNVKDIIADMEQRLVDLRQPPKVTAPDDGSEAVLKGILGQIVGQSPSVQKAQLDAVTQGANDLSSLVKRKPSKLSQNADAAPKRSAPDESSESDTKRTRVDKKGDTGA